VGRDGLRDRDGDPGPGADRPETYYHACPRHATRTRGSVQRERTAARDGGEDSRIECVPARAQRPMSHENEHGSITPAGADVHAFMVYHDATQGPRAYVTRIRALALEVLTDARSHWLLRRTGARLRAGDDDA
jgi:hypothetical protein